MDMRKLVLVTACLLQVLALPNASNSDPIQKTSSSVQTKKPAAEEISVKLEALKKRLPAIVLAWGNQEQSLISLDKVTVRLARRICERKAKITLSLQRKEPNEDNPWLLSIQLRYYDGAWTTTRWEATWPADSSYMKQMAAELMLRIDEGVNK
jgi:hypothetical protein